MRIVLKPVIKEEETKTPSYIGESKIASIMKELRKSQYCIPNIMGDTHEIRIVDYSRTCVKCGEVSDVKPSVYYSTWNLIIERIDIQDF